jgi:deoxyadenosine/deoxycytidine kinase
MSLEGIPGCGKTKVLLSLESQYLDQTDVVFRREPDFEWESIRQGNSSLLDLYYAQPQEAGFAFQLLYFLITERQLKLTLISDPKARVIVCERSLLSGKHVYIPLHDPCLNKIEHAVYDLLLQREGVRQVLPNHIVFLDSEPKKCLGKRSHKDMKGDEIITLEYLEKCRLHHKALAGKCTSEYTSIKSDPEELTLTKDKISRLIDNQNSQDARGEQETKVYEKPKVVCIEGNVGVGKSTLLNAIQKVIDEGEISDVMIFKEPLELWNSITDGTHTILELFYQNPSKYALAFQTLIALTTIRELQRLVREHPEVKVIICERSLLSSQMVFAESLREEGALKEFEYEVYRELFRDRQEIDWMYPEETIYLRTDPATCLQRIRERQREGEQRIDLKWLMDYQRYYERFFKKHNIQPTTLEVKYWDEPVRLRWARRILVWCDTLKSETWLEEESTSPQVDTEEVQSNTPNRQEKGIGGEIAIKLRYDDRYQYVIIDKYSISELMIIAYDAFPEIEDQEISHFSWKSDMPGMVEIVDCDLELKTAIEAMIEWERPVIRLEVICTLDKTHKDNRTIGENGSQKL